MTGQPSFPGANPRTALVHLVSYAVYRLASVCFRVIPLDAAFLLGAFLGHLASWLLPRRSPLARKSLQHALGVDAKTARKLARNHFTLLGANLLAMLKTSDMSNRAVLRRVRIEIDPGLPTVPPPSGWVAVLVHSGNWEIVSRLAERFPMFRLGAVYQPLANPLVNRRIVRHRKLFGLELFDRRTQLWDAIAFVDSGGVLGVFADQYAGTSGTWMPFFGRMTSTSTLPALIAHRVRTDIVPIVVTTSGLARWRVRIGPVITRAHAEHVTTLRVNRFLEGAIRQNPTDWLWSHDRWKTPKIGFLLGTAATKIFLPNGPSEVAPYRVLILSPDDPAEARLATRFVRAAKGSRPDAWVAVSARGASTEIWQGLPEVDCVVSNPHNATSLAEARLIASTGPFDVGIVLPPSKRRARVLQLAGVPVGLGVPALAGVCHWENPPGGTDPPPHGEERYRRIFESAGLQI